MTIHNNMTTAIYDSGKYTTTRLEEINSFYTQQYTTKHNNMMTL